MQTSSFDFPPIIIVGNKSDLISDESTRQVDSHLAAKYASERHCIYLEASTSPEMSIESVQEIFDVAIRELRKRRHIRRESVMFQSMHQQSS